MTATEAVPQDDIGQLERLVTAVTRLRSQVAQRIIGQDEIVEGILTAVLAGGHGLLIGVPGLAKTMMVQTIAEALNLSFNRVQFTPDLMPSDITGTEIIEEDLTTGRRAFRFVHGPVFANVVLATQNPIEQEGTYPLPEAQLDRFMLELRVNYPSRSEEEAIVEQTTGAVRARLEPVLDAETVLRIQALVRRIPVSKGLIRAAVALARLTRPANAEAPPFIKEYVEWGAGPRASQYLVLGAKARAAIAGRPMADLDDVKAVAPSVLRHRIVTNFAAEAADRSSADLVSELLTGKAWVAGL